MKLNNHQIELAAATQKDVRFYLRAPVLDTTDEREPKLVATDGHILAVVPIELDDGDTAGPVYADALKASRKTKEGTLLANGSLQIPGGAEFPRPENGHFPDWRRIIPEHDAIADICLDAQQIINLAKAICDVKGNNQRHIKFYFQKTKDGAVDSDRPVYVESADATGYGVIMPVRFAK